MMSRRKVVLVATIVVLAGIVGIASYRYMVPPTVDGIYVTKSKDPKIREAYDLVRNNQEVMAQLKCSCGCSEYANNPHQSVIDCYRTKHAETCTVCLNTAHYAVKASREGQSIDQIKRYLRNFYQFDYGLSSDAASEAPHAHR